MKNQRFFQGLAGFETHLGLVRQSIELTHHKCFVEVINNRDV